MKIFLFVLIILVNFSFVLSQDVSDKNKAEILKARIHDMRKKAEEVEKHGNIDEANKIREKAKHLESMLYMYVPETENDRKKLKSRIHEMRKHAEEVEKLGNIDGANKLRKEAEYLENKLHKYKPENEKRELKSKIHRMLKEAEELEKLGNIDEANELRKKAKYLESRLSGNFEKNFIKFWKFFEPEKLEHLKNLKKENPMMYMETKRRFIEEMMEIQRLKEKDPKAFHKLIAIKKLNKESWELAELYKKEKDRINKMKIRNKLNMILNKIFEIKIQGNKDEIEKLQGEINRLKKRLNNHIENKDKIIKKRMSQMLGEFQEFEWQYYKL